MAYEYTDHRPTEEDIGKTCRRCGIGHYVKNPHKGTIFCDEKCWLKSGDKTKETSEKIISNTLEAKVDFIYRWVKTQWVDEKFDKYGDEEIPTVE